MKLHMYVILIASTIYEVVFEVYCPTKKDPSDSFGEIELQWGE